MVKHKIVTKDHTRHEEGLAHFRALFESVRMQLKVGVCMELVPDKVMEEDGVFKDLRSDKVITFDWEQFKGYAGYEQRRADNVYQLERKVVKHKIDSFIQCSMDRKAIVFGYHSDVDMTAKPMTIRMTSPHYEAGYQDIRLYPLKVFHEYKWEDMVSFINFLRAEFDKE